MCITWSRSTAWRTCTGRTCRNGPWRLISIAHPDFRPGLLKEAVEAKYLRPDLARIEGKLVVGPPEFRTTHVLDDGTLINFRSIRPTDEPRLRDLFYALSQQTIYYRFMSHMTRMPRKQVQDFVYIDHRTEVAIVGTITEAYGEDLIAIGRYYLEETTNMAEVAFVVRDNWQAKGIGSFLLSCLMGIASGTASGASPPRCCTRTGRCKPSSTERPAKSLPSLTTTSTVTGWILCDEHVRAVNALREMSRSSLFITQPISSCSRTSVWTFQVGVPSRPQLGR